MGKLKVYRSPIGFHDVYVAAASQKAALKAWGSDVDLFARGIAEVVTDPVLAAEPLAHPGEVIKRSRGTADEQFAALPADRPKVKAKASSKPAAVPIQGPKVSPPRPDRASVESAERALEDQQARQREDDRTLAAEEAALAKRRNAVRAKHDNETRKLEADFVAAKAAYVKALKVWRAAS